MSRDILDLFTHEKRVLEELSKYYFEIGVFEEDAERKKKKPVEVTNAFLLQIHEIGSPKRGIPKRPILKQTLEHPEVHQMLNEAYDECETLIWEGSGGLEECEEILKQTALRIESFAKEQVATKAAKLVANKPRTIASKKSDVPLWDTGEMIKSITCVLKKLK